MYSWRSAILLLTFTDIAVAELCYTYYPNIPTPLPGKALSLILLPEKSSRSVSNSRPGNGNGVLAPLIHSRMARCCVCAGRTMCWCAHSIVATNERSLEPYAAAVASWVIHVAKLLFA